VAVEVMNREDATSEKEWTDAREVAEFDSNPQAAI
jgi:hypothetical protein